jgi:biopolymer transport protein TolR
MMTGRRHARIIRPVTPLTSDINITPLVDVVLVLLIIFMVVTPLLEKDLRVAVPAAETLDPAVPPPANQLVVSLATNGTLTLNGEVLSGETYVPRLKAVLDVRAEADRVVFFSADGAANYGRLVRALDGAKAAGATTLGMMTDELSR